ncbi:YqgU-like beta propeller domain-containing protein [Cytobacillus gottheilii]|uniref:YqgU-like beta propeller domain-containing protein n=1 Tax=Cytobacillus gottheilii TaxID=859144 RepID=UPI0009B98B94|nr:hypothetical protein [Cytobacillus gottheilii]
MSNCQKQKSNMHVKPAYLHVGFFLVLAFSLLLLSGCQKDDDSEIEADGKEANPPEAIIEPKEEIVPIEVESGQFSGIHGWLSEETVLYTVSKGASSDIYINNLYTGEKSLIYTSELPIVDVLISPDKEHLFIHTSVSTYEGLLTVTDRQGKVMDSQSLTAAELTYTWNPYNPNLILISAFSEDWTFSSYLMNIEEKSLNELTLKEPFVEWLNSGEVVYLDWSSENPALFAPLVKQAIDSEQNEVILDQIFQVKGFEKGIMTITAENDKMDKAVYTFMTDQFEVLSSFSVPQLTNYSDWLIPYSDFVKNQSFLSFQPLHSSEADLYQNGFQLINTNLSSGEREILLENAENEPLSCSPDGNACLYGYYFEKLILLEKGEIVSLVKEEVL